MKPVDPRLLRYARTTRVFLAASVALGLAGAGLVVAQAVLLADIVVGAYRHGVFHRDALLLLAAVSVGRGLVSWLTELAAHRSGAAVKSELRLRLLERATALGPGFLTGQRTGELTTLATRGIDALDDYFARYLPQLGLAVVVPVVVLARIVTADWISAAIIVVTLPLIPLFMALIGWATRSRMDRQWKLLSRLAGHFLDVVAGLPTLKVFGRAKAQADNIRAITGDYRRATLRTLRLAFLSSFALELLATISVALVAVGIGTRLVRGEMDLYTGLMVLILAPEAYLPLRQVGTHYHAAAEGLAAAESVFDMLERPLPPSGSARVDIRKAPLVLEGAAVRHEGRDGYSLAPTDWTVRPGETVAVTGPSGGGKSTLLSVLLGFTPATEGRVRVGDVPLADLDPAAWHQQIAWVPQHPYLFAGTIADNVRLARPDDTVDDAAVARALAEAGAPDLDPARELGESGAGLSAGQRRRVALARAFLADRPLVLLDEPTAALDGATESAVLEAVRRLSADRTVVLVTHRPALLAAADHVLTLTPQHPDQAVRHQQAAGRSAARGGSGDVPGRRPGEDHGGPRTPPVPHAQPTTGAPLRTPAPTHTPTHKNPLTRVRSTAQGLNRKFALALLLGTLALASAVGLMATSGWLISRAAQQPPILYLMVAVTATRAFGIGRAVFRYAERLVSHDAALRVLAALRVAVYRRLERLAPAGLARTARGDLLTRLVADVDALQDYFLRWLLPATVAATVGTGAVVFTAWLLPAAGAALAAGLAVAGIAVPALTAALSRRTERRLAPARAALATRTVDLLTGTAAGELPVSGALGARRRAVADADAVLTRIAARSASRTALAAGLSALAAGLTVTAAAWAGASAATHHTLGGVLLATVVLTPLATFEVVTPLPQAVQFRQRVRRSAERVHEVLDAPAPVREPEHPAPLPPDPFPLRVHRLTVRYPDAPAGAPPALAGLDLELTPGRRVAVVGASGSGKTTLAHALLRFVDAESGSYTLGTPAVAAADADADAVRRHVGLCAQDAHLFDSSLRENLRLALPRPPAGGTPASATEAELRAALAAARLDDWVTTLPEGLDTLVGEHGAKLSGGQRQRLALARALLADFPVLVLDEPAEHLDLPTADALTADLLAATEGRTTLLITHRLQGLDAVDEIIVLAEGRPVERGTYGELASAGGAFAAMLTREREAELVPTAGLPGPGRGR
ncbi:thiol reductant ABC exporter subunit CydD [Streptomyces albus subsp. chlorinus]|uniref:thiol reductant ABC exporter subunit CydD n=1 Tax=Streptomyces albus TaxID=1888 RepID=UPI00156DB8EC|nr:thiol reductant ABC exporter subunit CydD [Streptomyces albus]NSC22668.1 thiol reductant ABC exporter subunit CydD [Streptomyces albus subsp. chlorinus]